MDKYRTLTYTIPQTESKYINGRYAYNHGQYKRRSTCPESIEIKKRVSLRNSEYYGTAGDFWKFTQDDLKDTDIQCILGIRKVDLEKRIDYQDRPDSSVVPDNCQIPHDVTEQTSKPYHLNNPNGKAECLSIIYISRKDGKLCNDIFHTWCAETGLPFPEQLKHTALIDDCALSEVKHVAGIKNYFSSGWLSLFDVFRHKKLYGWYLPFSQWGTRKAFKALRSAFKTSYKRPKKLNTWRQRRTRR